MKKTILLLIAILCSMLLQAQRFEDFFEDKTLRIDYNFAGNAHQQEIAVDQLNVSPHWYGKRQRLAELPLVVAVPDENTGDVIGELNKRRGRVMGMTPSETEKGMTEVTAEVPIAEMSDFTLTLRQMTQGQGSFTLETARYDQLPANLVTAVIAASKTE